ncbi:MAG: beta-galactosidase [Sedimentisphaerales bacterium]|nr:beta-galactosidase [Sedimentisphaerales bacterium]
MKEIQLHCISTLILCALAYAGSVPVAPAPNPQGQPQPKFGFEGRNFVFDGKPAVIISGSVHYPRIPRAYWRDRMKKARAMGLNTISTYVFWNAHEKTPGEFDFSGNLDVAQFCRVAQEEGLWVIVRPSPYVCSEWDFGGLPPWLLKDPNMEVRTSDPKFTEATGRYLKEVGKQLAPLQASKGGPIIMVQVENEYAVFGEDRKYYETIKDQTAAAFSDVVLIRCDWPRDDTIKGGHLDGVLSTMNFGDNPQWAFEQFDRFYPDLPRMSGEFWTGWFDHWGAPHHTTSGAEKAKLIDWMLENGISFNLYMFVGGTNWGFTAGANWSGKYSCDTTSYDYSANLHEAGNPAEKFYEFRDVILKHLPEGTKLPELPEPIGRIEIPEIKMTQMASFMQLQTKPCKVETPTYMEALDQAQGLMLYRTHIKGPKSGTLEFATVKDRAFVMLDGKRVGTLDRRLDNQRRLRVDIGDGVVMLDVLVENMGHLNFSRNLITDRKGIAGEVKLNNEVLSGLPAAAGWEMYSFELDDLSGLTFEAVESPQDEMPYFYKATFNIDKTGDTFLDMRGWGKGMVWVNGYNLGRYWQIGPQQTLYMPGCWLKKGVNEIIVLDIEPRGHYTVKGLTEPVYELQTAVNLKYYRKPGQSVKLDVKDVVVESSFKPGATEQKANFGRTVQTRYICIETLNSQANDQYASIAEIHMLDAAGRKIDRNSWKVVYADSEELVGQSGGADNVIDDQPVTMWHTQWEGGSTPPHPHHLVLDLGKVQDVSALLYLPRADSRNGRIKDYRIYARKTLFDGLGEK